MPRRPLKFKVAPHIVEDLGLNLYTSLPRVLVEYVANAYDADASYANVTLNKHSIQSARNVLKKQFELEKAQCDASHAVAAPLDGRTLPDDLAIAIEDDGHGMSRKDLNDKFLFAGRRRRREEPHLHGRTAEKKRPLMGRKGLGKLAGFGVAKLITVVTRKKGEPHATKIVLDFDELIKKHATHEIEIESEEQLSDGGGLPNAGGTRVVLSRLLFGPTRSHSTTIEKEIAEHFALIEPNDFAIKLNRKTVKAAAPKFAFAWPKPDKVNTDDFVSHTISQEGGEDVTFDYRIRFTGENEALPAARRGIRVYAHKRLAAAPSLLDADTNMHGFRMTDYLDGVVHADFIEEQEGDYIATDRQTLRWDTPLLAEIKAFLSDKIKEACTQYQKLREDRAPSIVKKDPFTRDAIAKFDFSTKDQRMALRFAVILKNACKRGVDDPIYKTKFPVLLHGIGHGNILTAITELAAEKSPDLRSVAMEVARLTKDELDQFIGTVKARLKGIEALKKIVKAVDFASAENEKTIQKLFEESPWLINATYSQFLTADRQASELFDQLAKQLGIADYAPDDAKKKEDRPDLVFLIGSESLRRLVIVELKSANLRLEEKHRTQLLDYMELATEWLADKGFPNMQVQGQLMGTMAKPGASGRGVRVLRREMRKSGPEAPWIVRDYVQVLKDAEAAHMELLEIQRRADAVNLDS